MNMLEGQILQRQAYVMLWHAKIVSGAYALRDISCAGHKLNKDELLKVAMQTMERQVELLGELVEHLPVIEVKGEVK